MDKEIVETRKLTKTKEVGLSKRRFAYLLLVFLFRLFLDISYKYVISPEFDYLGFLNNQTPAFMVASWIIFIVFSFFAFSFFDNKRNQISKELFSILYLLAFVPFTTLVSFGLFSPIYVFCNSLYWAFLMIFGHLLNSKKRKQKEQKKRISGKNDNAITIFALISVFVVMFISARYANFRLNFNLFDVYDIRLEAREYNLPTILTYLYSFTKMTNAILITYYVSKKTKKGIIIGLLIFIVQLFSFGIDGSKTTLFLALGGLAFGILPTIPQRKLNYLFLVGMVLVTIAGLLLYTVFGNITLLSLISRRVLVDPQRISFQYFDFFTTHTPDFFRQSFLRYFGLSSPYEKPIAFVIAEFYEKESFSANNGLISDAMTNFGFAGLVLFPLIINILLNIFDRVSIAVDSRIKIIVSVYFSVVLTNSFLTTSLLTHGLLVVLLLLYVISKNELALRTARQQVVKHVYRVRRYVA